MVYHEKNPRRGNRNRHSGRVNKITAPRPGVTCNAILDCGCTRHLEGKAKEGSEYYCIWHKRIVIVVKAETEYVVDCVDCTFRRRRGQAKFTAQSDASRHALTRRHRVNIFYGAKLMHTVGKQTTQLTLDSIDDPPF